MYNFKCDYTEGAHPNILKKLIETNLIQENGYSQDLYSLAAKKIIRERLKNSKAEIYFLSGGTQVNLLVISSLLKVHEAVISTEIGHIFTHETGAIESCGHRVITTKGAEGKLRPEDIQVILEQYSMRPHMVKPRLVYISNSTEIGTIYKYQELKDLYTFCKQNDLLLFMDGARLGQAIMSKESDIQMEDLQELVDVFYIGGTKNGALLGEAIVFNQTETCPEFDYAMKQKGALLAKGRVLGIQFLELFTNDLFFVLAKHANDQAQKIYSFLIHHKIDFLTPTETNQLFPIVSLEVSRKLQKKYEFYEWLNMGTDRVALRLITSWATPDAAIDTFLEDFKEILKS